MGKKRKKEKSKQSGPMDDVALISEALRDIQ